MPPWHYAGDVIAVEFWANGAAAKHILPPGLNLDPESRGRVLALFADWQFTGQEEELLEPERYQYRGFHLLVDAHWMGRPVSWMPYAYVDNDAAMARGWVLGCPARLGRVFQTRSVVAPGPAAATIEPGTKFGVSLSACGQRLANGRLTLRQELIDRYRLFARPIVTRRYFPNANLDDRGKASVDELVVIAIKDLIIVDGWSGDAELSFPAATGEELHELSPVKIGYGHRFSISLSIDGVAPLEG